MKRRYISQEGLKLIACATMLLDHFGHAIVPGLPVPYMAELCYTLRIIGRIAFPIYCFLLVEGMGHTGDCGKYLLRLGIGIVLAELPFDILFEGGISWEAQSVMVTLTLGAVMLLCMEKTKQKSLKLLLVLPFAVLAEFAKCDYGGFGIAMIAVFALFDRLPVQALGLLLVNLFLDSAAISGFGGPVSVQLFAVAAMIPIGLYSGKKLTHSKAVQWAFYLFYPVHLLILWIILLIIR
jgi:hypothetical protein